MDRRVYVVMDSEYGARLERLAQSAPVWIVQSAINEPIAHELWRKGNMNVTTFKPRDFARLLPTLNEHHPDCQEIEVYGAKPSSEVSERLVDLGWSILERTPEGFRLR